MPPHTDLHSQSGLPPIPNAAEVERFRGLHRDNIGVDLDSAERMLSDLAQFYFLTRGYEHYQLLYPERFEQKRLQQKSAFNKPEPRLP